MTDQFTREDFDAVARYVGITTQSHLWPDYEGPGIKLMTGIVWQPHLPGADAFDLMCRANVDVTLRDAMPNHVIAWYADGEEHEGEFYVSVPHDNTPEGKARATALAIFKAVLAAAKAKGE